MMGDHKFVETAGDTAHSQHITDHPFIPGEWNEFLCGGTTIGGKTCRQAEAAHRTSNGGYQPPSDIKRVEYDHSEDDTMPITTPEIHLAEAEEFMIIEPTMIIEPIPEAMHCWRCGTTQGVRHVDLNNPDEPGSGPDLCSACETILKPGSDR